MDWIKTLTKRALSFQVLRYLFSGGTATFTNLSVFYALNSLFDTHYLIASGLAFLAGFLVSFTLHKFVTFQNYDIERAHVQVGLYLVFWGCNILVGVGVLYLFVEYARLPYIVGQACTVVLVAAESYFVYRYLVFGTLTGSKTAVGNHGEHTNPES